MTLATNVEFRAASGDVAKVTIDGLKGANATVGPISLGGSHPFTDAVWLASVTSEGMSLQFRIGADMSAGVPYVLSIEIANNFETQDAQEVHAMSSELRIAREKGRMRHDSLRLLSGIFDPKPGEGGPLFIRDGNFKVAKIGQSSPYPCSANVICVTLQPSIPLTAETKTRIEIFTLANARSADGTGTLKVYNSTRMAMLGVANPGVDVVKSPVSGVLSAGHWNDDADKLELQVTCRIEAGVLLTFCFNLINPAIHQLAPNVYVKSSNLRNGQLLEPPPPNTQPANVFKWLDPQGMTAHPMFVRLAEFNVGEAMQNSSNPCGANSITIRMSVNVPLVASCGVKITIHGLKGTSTSAGSLTVRESVPGKAPNGTKFLSAGRFDPTQGTLVIELSLIHI